MKSKAPTPATLAVLFLACMHLGWAPEVRSQICTFSWKEGVSGVFTDGGRWDPSFGCPNRAPLPGEFAYFVQGTYTVTFPGGQSVLLAEFAPGGTPPFIPFDITFVLDGDFTTQHLITVDELRVVGSGTLRVTQDYVWGGELVLDGANATLGQLFGGEIYVGNNSELVTLVNGVDATVDGGTWKHEGTAIDGDGRSRVGHITLRNGGRFESAKLVLGSQRLHAENGSTFEIDDLTTVNHVTIQSGSQMVNRVANLGFGDEIVDGTGSKWTVSETLLVPGAAQIIATNRAEFILGQVVFSDPAGFAALHAKGTDSRINIYKPLVLLHGNANAVDGGTITVPHVEVGAGRQIVVRQGPAGLGGAQFTCTGEMIIGPAGTTGGGNVQVSGGGRASARSLTIGQTGLGSVLAVDASGGTARFDVEEDILVGDAGRGTLRVSNGAQFHQASGFLIVTPAADGEGDVTVEGADSSLEAGTVHVGRGDVGQLNVMSGARLVARGNMLIGDGGADDIRDPALTRVTVSGANSSLQAGEVYVERGTLRVMNAGLFQAETRLHMAAPSVVDLVGGRGEVGRSGGAPSGVLRVDQGLLDGSGTIRASSVEVVDQGTCRPGEFVQSHQLRIQEGSYRQDADGTLEIDILGTEPQQFGTLVVDRSATLNGRLVVNFVGYTPRANDEFGFLHFGEGLVGTFAEVIIQGLAPGITYEQRQLAPGVYGIAFLSDGTSAGCSDPAPVIEGVDASIPGEIAFTITAGVCGLYELEYSKDADQWRPLQRFKGDASGRVRVVDRSGNLYPLLFYRVVRLF